MGKDKIAEKMTEVITEKVGNTQNKILQYSPIILSFVSILICYLLFKKIQSLEANSSTMTNIETELTKFIKEQTDLNKMTIQKYNELSSQINQIGYLLQNTGQPFVPDVPVQAPVQAEMQNQVNVPISENNLKTVESHQREMIAQIPNGVPIVQNNNNFVPPIPENTSSKKELNSNREFFANIQSRNEITSGKNEIIGGKKVINLETEEAVIEEVSSDDDE